MSLDGYRKYQAEESTKLTHREEQVAVLIHQELTSQEIADQLSLSIGTITTYTGNLIRKMGVRGRVGIALRVERIAVAGPDAEPGTA